MVIIKYSLTLINLRTIEWNNDRQSWCFLMVMYGRRKYRIIFCLLVAKNNVLFLQVCAKFSPMVLPNGHPLIVSLVISLAI